MALIQVDGARKKISPKEPISWALPPKRPHPIRPKQLEPEIVSEPIVCCCKHSFLCVCMCRMCSCLCFGQYQDHWSELRSHTLVCEAIVMWYCVPACVVSTVPGLDIANHHQNGKTNQSICEWLIILLRNVFSMCYDAITCSAGKPLNHRLISLKR